MQIKCKKKTISYKTLFVSPVTLFLSQFVHILLKFTIPK